MLNVGKGAKKKWKSVVFWWGWWWQWWQGRWKRRKLVGQPQCTMEPPAMNTAVITMTIRIIMIVMMMMMMVTVAMMTSCVSSFLPAAFNMLQKLWHLIFGGNSHLSPIIWGNWICGGDFVEMNFYLCLIKYVNVMFGWESCWNQSSNKWSTMFAVLGFFLPILDRWNSRDTSRPRP